MKFPALAAGLQPRVKEVIPWSPDRVAEQWSRIADTMALSEDSPLELLSSDARLIVASAVLPRLSSSCKLVSRRSVALTTQVRMRSELEN